jgi:hypothetical protein
LLLLVKTLLSLPELLKALLLRLMLNFDVYDRYPAAKAAKCNS